MWEKVPLHGYHHGALEFSGFRRSCCIFGTMRKIIHTHFPTLQNELQYRFDKLGTQACEL